MKIIGKKIIHTKECFCSSIDWAKENLEHVPDGTMFLADHYHVARGQFGRVWKIYPGQLTITFVLKPPAFNDNFETLNQALILGIYEPLKKYGVSIKLPNDFMINNKKVGGMLTEVVWSGGLAQGLVVGLSINCNNVFEPTDELYEIATSLRDVSGKEIDLDLLYKSILLSLDRWYKAWINGKFESIASGWKGRKIHPENKLSVQN